MNLTIDIGNTRSKLAIFNQGEILEQMVVVEISVKLLKSLLDRHKQIQGIILSSVKTVDSEMISFLNAIPSYFIELNEKTLLPIDNQYKTKKTLGKDRLAAIIGANNILPKHNVLVIDMGTAITFDFITSQNQYLGGTISPGMEMRFKALNHFTDQLPLLHKKESFDLIANSTESAIISGVQNGIIHEINGYINTLKNKYNDLKTFLTGGDAIFFDKKVKNTIFVNLNLNHIGLNTILEFNRTK